MHTGRAALLLAGVALAGWFLRGSAIAAPRSLVLAKNGGTDYVLTGNRDEADITLALGELADHLKAATGTDFRTVPVAEAEKLSRRIVVGDNPLSRSILGKALTSSLDQEESLMTVKGRDIVLVGGSPRASLYAAYSFLENEVGCRWYAFHLDPLIPHHARLLVRKTTRRERTAFTHRNGGFNGLSDRRLNARFCLRNRYPDVKPSGKIDPGCHTLFYYVPPHEHEQCYALWGYPPRSNLFETHPEFFSLSASGQRVDNLQLCFSNVELREVLTSQIDAIIKKSEYRDYGYIALEANDVPGKFCYCPECRKLEEKYDNTGGPLYDYLFELSDFLKREHPGVAVKIMAYRKKQTELPPNIKKLPDNVILHFAAIDDSFAAGLNHPTNRETLNNLKRWCQIAEMVWVWYYTNPFMTAGPPFASLRRTIDDLRTMREIGVSGVTFQQTTGSTDMTRGLNFTDLETWMLMKLSYDPNRDAEALIDEFTGHYYGEAATLMRAYLRELESLREAMKIKLPWNPSFPMFTYLTPERLIRWQHAFHEMEKLTAGSIGPLRHVRTARITLDAATLKAWPQVAKRHAELGVTPAQIGERIKRNMSAEIATRCEEGRQTQCWGPFGKQIDGLLLRAQAAIKPLLQVFDAFAPDRIREILPDMAAMTEDTDAASGYALVRDCEHGVPVTFGLYDDYNGKPVISREIQREEIKPDRYSVYRLGRATLSPQCCLWMTDAWVFTIPLEEAYIEGDPLVQWDVYASLKFGGPKYGSQDKGQPNRIACDRVVLVRRKADVE